ncbi:hypothetical protein OsI_36392 [Oryza sativa Indica Group]|uniref:Uncharacterized protein n=1 Tax=Oryza sativa subsp. indica TaxID=39946 RepID=A2ZF31_ORYSI|nr:hypothetical protein OsI_36392 [Oryza sativa Indica Group]
MASPSWVAEIERYISGDAGGRQSGAMTRGSKPGHSIYRVPEYIKKMTNPNAYRPQLVSLGPFHHDDTALKPMEKHKCRAVANLVKRSGKPLLEFITAVEEIKMQLQDAYENLEDIWYQGTRFVEMMLKDGCFLLEMARVIELHGSVEDYEPDDSVFSKHGRLYLLSGIQSDVVLMENQLPLFLLRKLINVAYGQGFLSYHRLS